MTFIKTHFLSLIILILLAVLFLQRCGGQKDNVQVAKRDTVTSIQYIQQPAVQIPAYQPTQPIIIKADPANIPIQYTQLSTDIKEVSRQLQDLAAQFYAVRHYKDSIQLKDSAGNDVGKVHLLDVISENKIVERSPSYELRFPERSTTITIHEPYKPVSQVYVGLGITGSKDNLVSSIEAGAMLKNKKDQLYGIKAGIGANGNVTYGLQSYWKIKLHK